jgi:hypothetical protein
MRNMRFPMPGEYTFEMRQGTRDDILPLVTDAGIRIEKAD